MTSISPADPINDAILRVSEDQLNGFQRDPMRAIAERSGIPVDIVLDRIRAMLRGGTIRRVRQTLLATNLAQGALVAWKLDGDDLDGAFDWLLDNDPFTGHIVIRTAETKTRGADYRLWTTLKVPKGFSIERHCEILASAIGAERFRIMPALRAFVLGVGHLRRRGLAIGARAPEPAEAREAAVVDLDENEWRVLMALKREFAPEELSVSLWEARAREANVDLDTFFAIAEDFDRRGVIGRFSTFLEHVKPVADGEKVTRFNGLYQWAVPPGREIEAGREIGRHLVLTHCYWRDGGPELGGVNIMAVAHAENRETVMLHKLAIDEHLRESGIPILASNIFWGTRSEVRPSEISPVLYGEWLTRIAVASA